MAVKLTVGIVVCGTVEGMEAQRAAYYVNAYAVGKLGRRRPIVLFGKAFGITVLAPQQPERGIRSRPDECTGHVGGHYREHLRAMVHLLKYAFRAWHNEVCRADNTRFLQARDAVGVHKASVKHGNSHSASAKAAAVKLLAGHHLGLFERHSVSALLYSLPVVELRMIPRTRRRGGNRVGRRPHLADGLDASEQRDALQP